MKFFGEEISLDAPKDLASLRTLIKNKFFLSKKDSNSLVLVHEQNSEKKPILTEEDYKAFLELKEKSSINIEINEAKQEKDTKSKKEKNAKSKKEKEAKAKQEKETKEKEAKEKDAKTKEEKETKAKQEKEAKEKEAKEKDAKAKQEQEAKAKEVKEKEEQDAKAKEEQEVKAKEEINQLEEKNNSLDQELSTKFVEQKKQINALNKQINNLKKEKNKIVKAILEEKEKIIKQKKENIQKINQIKKQLNSQEEQNKKINPCKTIAQKIQRIHKKGKKRAQMRNSMNELLKNVKTILSPQSPSLTEEEKKASVRGLVCDTINMVKSFTQEMEKKKRKKKHLKKQQFAHYNVQCDGCKVFPIVGKRFQCKTCPNFDYCEKCYNELSQKHGHEFNMISEPVRYQKLHHNHVHVQNQKPIETETKPIEVEKESHSSTQKNSSEKTDMKKNPWKTIKNHHSLKRLAHKKKNLSLKHNNTVSDFKKIAKPAKKEEKKIVQNEIKEDKKEEVKNVNDCIHTGIKCQGCGMFPIVGCRFKCIFCDGFDYCEDCEKKLALEHGHPFLKMRDNLMKIEIKK